MRLTFRILWFDDSGDFFDSHSLDIEGLKNEIFSWGFSPRIDLVTTPEEFLGFSPYKEFDLIVVDRNLDTYGGGQNFIAELRNNSVYTEVIFYTAGNASDLWKDIYEKKLEGIFVSNRGAIMSKIRKVGHQAIRKVMDLENMRGIVMAEVGELDHLLDAILTAGVQGLSAELQKSVFKKFHKEAEKQNQEFGLRLVSFSENPTLAEMLTMCDSNKRWENFNRLWKYHDKLKDQEKIGDYRADVLDLRNVLAHGTPEPCDGGYLFRHRNKEYIYNEESSNDLRKTILKYKTAFSHVLITLQE